VRRASLAGLAGAVVAASAAGSAHAAPPWSEPRSVGAATGTVSAATIAFGPGGTALLSRNAGRLATLTPGGRLVEHRPLSDRLAAPPQLFGRGRVVLLREHVLSEEIPRRVRLSVSLGSTATPAGRGRPHRLATFTTFPNGGSPAMAVGPQGQIAIVWMTWKGATEAGRFRVRLALRGPKGRFETRTVASGATDQSGVYDPPGVAVAIGARGDVVVAYSAVGQFIRARTLRRGRLGPPQALGPHATAVDLAARASRTGRVVVAWGTQDGGEEFDEPYVVRAAVRAPGAARFGPLRVIDPGELNGEFVPHRIRLAMNADGTAALTWANASGRFPDGTRPVRVAVAEQDGGFGPIAELAANGVAQDVAVRGDGAALVAWTDPGGAPFAALRTGPGQPFGPSELVSISGNADPSMAVAYDPRTRSPTAVWAAPSHLQLATRAG
jgi:hypothetical protein